ncbi:hypothetical protein ACIBSV_15355 [Embleya sp. NPDC050154]|uniref:hypothetical protein n=1 Tax=Embleya sp. NPDC050154 TaxID=3363988 RepID=UPI003799CA81
MSKSTKASPEKSAGPGLDWAAGHGPVSGALSATTGCAAVALAGTAAGMPWAVPAAIGAAGALGHGLGAGLYRHLTGTTMRVRAMAWILAGGWTSWAVATDPLTWTAAGTLGALGVGVGAMASHAAVVEEAAEEEAIATERRALERELGRERTEIAREWRERIRRVCQIDVQVLGVEPWASGAGYDLDLKMPPGRVTWKSIRNDTEALAADAELPIGCTVNVTQGVRQGRAILEVATRAVLSEIKDYPLHELEPLSILAGIPWGLFANGSKVLVHLREACAIILGVPGSGKSTFLNNVIAGFCRCPDVVTWVIDLKGGAVAAPWLRPWMEAQGLLNPLPDRERPPAGTKPAVDWVATTPGEALDMLTAALDYNSWRQRHHQELMARHNTTLLPVSAQVPMIEIVIDEGAELLALANTTGGSKEANQMRREIGRKILKVMQMSRAMGIRLVLTAVDGNVSNLGSTDLRKNSPVRAVLTAQEADNANVVKLFPRAKIDVAQYTSRGNGVVAANTGPETGFPAAPFTTWRCEPDLCAHIALATDHLRASLEPAGVRHLGSVYTERWSPERTAWIREICEGGGVLVDRETRTDTDGSTDTGTGTVGPQPGGLNLSAHRNRNTGGGTGGPDADVDAQVAELSAAIDARFGTTDEPEPLHGLNLSAHRDRGERSGPEPTEPAPAGPDWLPTALAAIHAAGTNGMGVTALAELVVRDRKTIREVLKKLADTGALVYREDGPRSVFVHPDHA